MTYARPNRCQRRYKNSTRGSITRVRGWKAGTCFLFALVLGGNPEAVEAQRRVLQTRQPSRRLVIGCGGDRLDGRCGFSARNVQCSSDPGATDFDADCFSLNSLESPEPDAACAPNTEPCEIHEAIDRMGLMFESGVYDNKVMAGVVLSYWDSAYWDLPDRWGAHGLDGYVVYAVVRNALKFHQEIEAHPTTRAALEQMLRDHADRGLPTTVGNGERWFHGGEARWNSWSEDYMAFALGYAAADAWFASPVFLDSYFDEYREKVGLAVDLAFSISHESPQTLRFETDADPSFPENNEHVMIRNHTEYSPVYAMAIIARLWDINTVYQAASLPAAYTCYNKPENLDALYEWMALKIEPNPEGAGYVFRSDACERRNGKISNCDDRAGDGTPGHQREPAHYPLDQVMPNLCVTDYVEYFGPSCDFVGPAGIGQRSFNYFFNCAFQSIDGLSTDEEPVSLKVD